MVKARKPKAKAKAKPVRKTSDIAPFALPPVKTARLADLFGVSAQMIGTWAALGVVVKTGHGTFNLEKSIKGWAKFMRASRTKATTATATVAGERALLLKMQRQRGELELGKAQGIVEIDETFVVGKETNKHESKKLKAGRGTIGNTPVIGMRERGGRTVAMPVDGVDRATVQAVIERHVEVGATPHTDEAAHTRAFTSLGTTTIRSTMATANTFART